LKCETCKGELVQLGYLGSKGGFYPLRNPTRYYCLRCKKMVGLKLSKF
jgi:hypothetical protein